jgi:hypothetical protein
MWGRFRAARRQPAGTSTNRLTPRRWYPEDVSHRGKVVVKSAVADKSDLNSDLYLWAVPVAALTALLVGFCLWWPNYLPLLDLPNHMARHWLESRALIGEVPPGYRIRYDVLPNLGADLAVPPLLLVLDVKTAARVYLTISAVLFWLGPLAYLCAVLPDRRAAVAAGLFLLPCVFNVHLFMGFLNYYSGLGIAFLIVTHFLLILRADRPSVWQLGLHTLLVTLLFFWHLALWGVYGVIMFCHLAVDTRQRRQRDQTSLPLERALRLLLPTLPSVILLGYYLVVVRPGSAFIMLGTVQRKVELPFEFFRSYSNAVDLLVFLMWFGALLACFRVEEWRSAARGGALWSVVLLGVLFVIIPFRLGTTAHTDSRLLPGMLVCALAVIGSLPLRRFRLACVLLLLAVTVRGGVVAYHWMRLSEPLTEQAKGFEMMEPGSRVLPFIKRDDILYTSPAAHFVSWSVPLRGCFVPILFHLPDQQPLWIDMPNEHCHPGEQEANPAVEDTITDADIGDCYDYVWVLNTTRQAVHVPHRCKQVFAGGDVTLYRVER